MVSQRVPWDRRRWEVHTPAADSLAQTPRSRALFSAAFPCEIPAICIYQTPEGGHISLNSIYNISEIAWNMAPWLSGALFSHIHIFLSCPRSRADALILFFCWLQQQLRRRALNVSDTPFIAFSCSQWMSDTANNTLDYGQIKRKSASVFRLRNPKNQLHSCRNPCLCFLSTGKTNKGWWNCTCVIENICELWFLQLEKSTSYKRV